MENDQNMSQQTVKRHKSAIQAIYSVSLSLYSYLSSLFYAKARLVDQIICIYHQQFIYLQQISRKRSVSPCKNVQRDPCTS